MSTQTEKEKMLAGERYTFFDTELEAERQSAKTLMNRFNQTQDASEHQTILRQMLGASDGSRSSGRLFTVAMAGTHILATMFF